MVKGVFIALGIMVLLALIPIVVVVGIPFGAFIGGYFGISSAGSRSCSDAYKAIVFGGLLGLLVFLVLVAVAISLTVTVDLSQRFLWLLWLSVVVFALYTASMGSLGAMYSQLKKSASHLKDESPTARPLGLEEPLTELIPEDAGNAKS